MKTPVLDARILVVFGNIPLLGKERGNIQALHVLKEQGADVLFATNKEWGHESIEPALDAIGMSWRPMAVARALRRAMTAKDVMKVARDVLTGWWELGRIIRDYRPTHIHIPNEYQSLYNLPVLMLARCPIVYRLGDEPVQSPPILNWLWRTLVIPNVTTFVCISEYVRRKAIENGVSDRSIRVIYNYPPERTLLLAGEEPEVVEVFDGRTVVYIGQLSKDKGVDLLVEVAIDLCQARNDVRFLIAGDYTWQNPFAEALIAQVQASGLSDRIRFLGYVKDVPSLLATADLHVCPSVWEEPLSNVVPEAKQASVPSVIFASGGLPELVTHGVDSYICEAKTAGALREGIEHFVDMTREELREAGAAARASLDQLGITKQAFAKAWREVYESI